MTVAILLLTNALTLAEFERLRDFSESLSLRDWDQTNNKMQSQQGSTQEQHPPEATMWYFLLFVHVHNISH